ncbi:hypothetical protein ACES2I_03565 [Bdellovibrio bacteriovorus]|uniref:hypothetical protein n=1 Tax=Bdellovibrio bacteriovorus TaxID=959 RepID=UPI0035A5CF47
MKLQKELTMNFSIHIFVFVAIILLMIFGYLKRVPVSAELFLLTMLSSSFYNDAKTKAGNRKINYGLALGTGVAALSSLVDYLKAANIL